MSALFRTSAESFSAVEQSIADRLSEGLMFRSGARASAAERRSWERSLPVLRSDLMDAGLPHVEMLCEYAMPLSSKRADVVLAGHHPTTGRPSYLVVELKQWDSAELYEGDEDLVTVAGHRDLLHPGLQVNGYCDYLADFTGVFADEETHLAGAAYLHNATNLGVADLLERPQSDRSRVFTGQNRSDWLAFLQSHFAADTAGASAADLLLNSRIAPSRQLLAVAAEEVQHREQFVLLDEQRAAYEHVLHAVEKARHSNVKTAVVIAGGPGSGKSVIALSLMGELARQGRSVVHATGSRSFTQTLRKVAAHRNPRIRALFSYFNQFMVAEPNELDCLILDEAHRLRETSVSRYTPKHLRERARPQVQELLAAARVPVFLLDEYQVVRPGEMGTVQEITDFAEAEGLDVVQIRLDEQFRCGGSQQYVDWVLRLLGLEEGGPIAWTGDDRFDVRVVDSPQEMEVQLHALQSEGFSARMTAGYCWPWGDPDKQGNLPRDVQIGTWAKPWNLKGDRAVGGAPPAALWATDPAGFGQVGCVYTAQGFEYDHAGVIIGPDLVLRDGRWVARRSENRDPDFRNTKKVSDERFDALVRNVYKVLLTRGMQSVRIHSVDPETNEALKGLVHQ